MLIRRQGWGLWSAYGFLLCKESDDDLLWLRHHIDETDVSLYRKKLTS